MKRWLYWLLLAVFCGIFLVSAFVLGDYLLEGQKQQNEFDDLAALVQQAQPVPSTVPETSPSPTDGTEPPPTEPPLVELTDPETGETVLVLPEYAEVFSKNTDMVGWLQIADTHINYPVMQTPDRPDYYLDRNFSREYSSHGCIYARENCDVFTPSDNVTLYGHNMKNSTMFADLFKYRRYDFWQSHPTFRFDTLTERHTYEVLALFVTTASEGKGFAYHQFINAANEENFAEFVSTCKALSLFDTGVEAVYGDKLLTLSTCEYSRTNGRLVLVAKRID